jgi:hypothetical protein
MLTTPLPSTGYGADHIENTCSLAATCILSRCLEMVIFVTLLSTTEIITAVYTITKVMSFMISFVSIFNANMVDVPVHSVAT